MAWIPYVAAAIQTVSSIASATSANKGADYNAQIEKRQQQISLDQAAAKAAQAREQGVFLVSSQQAAAGGAGVAGRSLLDVMFETYRQSARVAQDATYQGDLDVYASKLRASQFQASKSSNILRSVFEVGSVLGSLYSRVSGSSQTRTT